MARLMPLLTALAVSATAPSTARVMDLARTPILDATIDGGGTPVSRVRGARIGFAPGQRTGLHRHPFPVVGVVSQGSFLFKPAGERSRLLRTGDAFFEPPGRTIELFDNASRDRPAAIEAFYLGNSTDHPLIEMLPGAKQERAR